MLGADGRIPDVFCILQQSEIPGWFSASGDNRTGHGEGDDETVYVI